jgi:hypothetical protein
VFSHFRKKLDILISLASFFRKFENVLWVAFLIPSGTLSLVKYPVLIIVVYLTSSCVNWGSLARVGQFKTQVKRAF